MTGSIQRLIFLLAVPLWLAACGGVKDTAEPPAELTKLDHEVKFKKLWRKDMGKGSGKLLLSLKPLVDAEAVYVSDHRGKIWSLDKVTGKKRWKTNVDTEVSTAFGEGVNTLYVGSRAGQLIALSKADGAELWRADLTGEALSSPVSAFGVVVVRASDGSLHGLSEATGESLWVNRRTVPNLTLRGTSTPVVDGGRILVGMDNGRLLAVSALDGRVTWEVALGVPQGRTELERMVDVDVLPVVERGLVYASAYQGRVAAISSGAGQVLWTRDVSVYKGVALDGEGSLYACDENSLLWALDKRSGATLWVQDKLRARRLTSPVVLGDYIITADFEGYIHVLSVADGRLLGRKKYNDEAYLDAAVLDGDRLYMLDVEGELSVFQLEALERT